MSLSARIKTVVEGQSLTEEEAYSAACELMDGNATHAQVAAILIALKIKGETASEITGFVRAMRERVIPVRPQSASLLDLCGTGGSAFRVFNVSTAAAFVVASFGIPVAKHGNRAQSGICGSADVLEALGVNLALTPEQLAACIDAVGIGFLFAQAHHPAMKFVAPVRRELGLRTIFNLLGPLTNPAGATRQVLGVYDPTLAPLLCETLRTLGTERAFVLHGEPGLDEISTLGETQIYSLRDGTITQEMLTPLIFGITPPADLGVLSPASTPEANAALLREALSPIPLKNEAAQARRDLVFANVAAALILSDKAADWQTAVNLAKEQIQTGKPLQTLENLIAFTQKF